MNPINHPKNPLGHMGKTKLTSSRSRILLSAMALGLLASAAADAATASYRYYRFAPTRIQFNNGQMQISEFTLSLNGTVLNVNNRNGSGTNVVPVTVTAGGQDVNAGEGALKVFDNDTGTKWFNGNALTDFLQMDFGTPLTIDSYNFATANDSVEFGRTPESWLMFGSSDGVNWTTIDRKVDVALDNQNLTYQAGFPLPADVPPFISKFQLASGVNVVKNGQSVTLDWQTYNADAGGVSINQNIGVVPAAGTQVVTNPSNTTSTYTLTAARATPAASATDDIQVRSVEGGTSSYQYVRFTPILLRGGTTIQLSEFEFYNGVTKQTVASVTNPGGNSPAAEPVEELIDGITNEGGNKWLDSNAQPVIFDFGSVKTFDSYQFYTGGDAIERDPIRWLIEGSNDSATWTVIDFMDIDFATTTARNAASTVIPLPGASFAPLIENFTTDGTTKIVGEPVTIFWGANGTGTYSISPGVGTVTASGSQSLGTPPVGTTTYTFTTTSPNGLVTNTATFDLTIIEQPTTTTIAYDDFSAAGTELSLLGSAEVVDNRLRLTPEEQSQRGEVWFRTPQPVANGFEVTFGLSMNQTPSDFIPADGLAFVIQNSPMKTGTTSNGETGVPDNALNISFSTFGFPDSEGEGNASRLRVIAGDDPPLANHVLETTYGIDLKGTKSNPATTAINPGDPPHQVRIVYFNGKLDVYFNKVCVVQNLEVDLNAIGAVDGTGKAYVGFTARTGGNVQNNDITDWHMRFGDFTALPPFGMVASRIFFSKNSTAAYPDRVQLVWDSNPEKSYTIEVSSDMTGPPAWEPFISGIAGDEGQVLWELLTEEGPRSFFRVTEEP